MLLNMTKQNVLFLAAILFALTGTACKNKAGDKSPEAADALPAERTDSLVGFEGCQRAGFKVLSPQVHEFKYQHYTFLITRKEDGTERIEARIDSLGRPFKLADVEPTFFMGSVRGHFFVDVGTGPDIRELIVYSLGKQTLSQVYRTSYLAAEPPFVSENGHLWFYVPVPENEVGKMPDCPDKADWVEKGFSIGYGQRYLYNLVVRGLTRKSEYICVPLQ